MSDEEELNIIANAEFGMDYCFLGNNEKEWCDEEKIYDRTKWQLDENE